MQLLTIRSTALIAGLGLCANFGLAQATFTPIGTLGTQALGISADGQWISGFGGPGGPVFRWSQSTGHQGLAGGFNGQPRVANGGQPVFASFIDPGTGLETAGLWTSAGITFLPTLGSSSGSSASSAYALSNNGTVCAGLAWINAGKAHAFKWSSSTGTIDLGALNNGSSRANGISGDGAVVVGWDSATDGTRYACYWDASNTLVPIGLGVGECYNVNGDGSVIVGVDGQQAFRWTSSVGLVNLGGLSTWTGPAYATDVSDDGQTVVGGQGSGPLFFNGWRALIWRPGAGMRELSAVAQALGATGLSGYTLGQAYAISANGRSIAGSAVTGGGIESFLLTLPEVATVYCVAQMNSQSCTPAIGYNGTPSATNGSGFHVTAANLIPGVNGILFYSTTGADNSPFLGGTLCAMPPLQRLPIQNTGGSTGCSGTFDRDFNAWVPVSGDAALVGGATVWAQFWSRDAASASTTNLTDAVRFTLWP